MHQLKKFLSKKQVPNELDPALLGPSAMNPLQAGVSASRSQMFSGAHLGQMLVISGGEPRRLQSGMEREYGEMTFKTAMPEDGTILHVVPRYADSLENTIVHNPQTVVIYENAHTREIGMFSLVDFNCLHQYFGFRYKKWPAYDQIMQGAYFSKGTTFCDSPSVTEDGEYCYGINANIAYMTMPGTSEDGIIISRSFLRKLGYMTYETRVIEWGRHDFALNLYGTDTVYKPYPDIGDKIPENNVVMALRSLNPVDLTIVEQSRFDVREIQDTFDHCTYAAGPGGVVVDVKVDHDWNDRNVAASNQDQQVQKYDNSRRKFYHRLMTIWHELQRQQGKNLRLSGELHTLLVKACSVIDEEKKGQRVVKQNRKAPLDTYRVEITIEYANIPSIGNKLSDTHGGKGVVCKVVDEQDMPIDEAGNRADVVMDPNSTNNRSNPSRIFEQYFNAVQRDTGTRLAAMLGTPIGMKSKEALPIIRKVLAQTTEPWDYLMGYYEIISPLMRDWFNVARDNNWMAEYLAAVINTGLTTWFPTNNPPMYQDIVNTFEIEENGYKPTYGPVSYVGNSGRRVTTKKPVRIASVYMILLEKVGDDWNAVASGKLQHHGVLAQLGRSDKYLNPARTNPVRAAGEAEIRIFLANLHSLGVAEIMDWNNNPQTHRVIVDGYLSASQPSNIERMIDRNMFPLGGSKPLMIIRHMLETAGIQLEFTPYELNVAPYRLASVSSNREAASLKEESEE
jgi:hypothetical protein